MTTTQSNQKILKVLRKMDDVLHRYGINHYQERLHRIHKVLLSIERHSNCYVTDFSLDNFDINLNDKYIINTEKIQNSPIKEFNNKIILAEDEKTNEDLKPAHMEHQNKKQIHPFSISSPVKTKRMSNFFNFTIGEPTEDLKFEETEISKTVNAELDDLFKFIEEELNVQCLLTPQDSTQFSSNSEGEEEKFHQRIQFGRSNDKDENFSGTLDTNEKMDKAYHDNIFISAVPNAKKKTHKLENAKLIKQNNDIEDPCYFDKENNFSLLKDLNNNFNHNNQRKESKNDFKVASSLIKANKQFSSSQKENQPNKETEIANSNRKEQAKADFKTIFTKIEHKLRNYLKQSHHQKIFESKAFESFLNEDKLRTPCSFNTAKSQTPSIIKNFFEDKEVIEVTRKRHSVAGECLKNQLENIREFEFKQKCLSNLRDNQSLLRQKDSMMDRKQSHISDFSVNLSENDSVRDFEGSAVDKDWNSTEFCGVGDDRKATETSEQRMSGVKLIKRGSILRERLSNFNSMFDVVHEEERFVDLDQSTVKEEDEIKLLNEEESD